MKSPKLLEKLEISITLIFRVIIVIRNVSFILTIFWKVWNSGNEWGHGLLQSITFQFDGKSITWLVITFQDLFALLRDFCWHMQKRENLKAPAALPVEAKSYLWLMIWLYSSKVNARKFIVVKKETKLIFTPFGKLDFPLLEKGDKATAVLRL